MERIDVYYKPIAGGNVYHNYIVYTDSSGKQFAARGGPEGGSAGSSDNASGSETCSVAIEAPKTAGTVDAGDLKILKEDFCRSLDDCPYDQEDKNYLFAKIQDPELFGAYEGPNTRQRWRRRTLDRIKHAIRCNLWLLPHILVLAFTSYFVFQMILTSTPVS